MRPAGAVTLLADGGEMIGSGHIMRTLTLGAEFVRQGYDVTLVARGVTAASQQRADALAIKVNCPSVAMEDARIAAEVAIHHPDILIRDGYRFSEGSAMAVENAAPFTVVIDDNREAPLGHPKVILNQNLHASIADYSDLSPMPLLLLGTDFALIRAEVTARLDEDQRPLQQAGIFISMGGNDPFGLAGTVESTLSEFAGPVVVAEGLRHDPRSLQSFVDNLCRSQLAVLSAGSQTWEAACLGVPVIAIATVENQRRIAAAAAAAGFAEAVDWTASVSMSEVVDRADNLLRSPERLASMRVIGPTLVDGRGAQRAVNAIIEAARE